MRYKQQSCSTFFHVRIHLDFSLLGKKKTIGKSKVLHLYLRLSAKEWLVFSMDLVVVVSDLYIFLDF